MRAALLETPGAPFRIATVARPAAGPGEALVRIAASGVNPLDLKIHAGEAEHARVRLPAILGLDLAGVVVATMAPYCQAELVHPRVWKGQRPKDVDNRWTLSQLDADELAVAGKNHNVLDAIGLGLWRLKRR